MAARERQEGPRLGAGAGRRPAEERPEAQALKEGPCGRRAPSRTASSRAGEREARAARPAQRPTPCRPEARARAVFGEEAAVPDLPSEAALIAPASPAASAERGRRISKPTTARRGGAARAPFGILSSGRGRSAYSPKGFLFWFGSHVGTWRLPCHSKERQHATTARCRPASIGRASTGLRDQQEPHHHHGRGETASASVPKATIAVAAVSGCRFPSLALRMGSLLHHARVYAMKLVRSEMP